MWGSFIGPVALYGFMCLLFCYVFIATQVPNEKDETGSEQTDP